MQWPLRLFAILIYINSIYLIYANKVKNNVDYIIILLIVLVQAFCIVLVWAYKKAWINWIFIESKCDSLDKIDLESHIVSIFLFFDWFIFCCILPYAFYVEETMNWGQICTAFTMSLMLWIEINRTSFKRTVFGLGAKQNIFVAIPYVTITVLIVELSKISHTSLLEQATGITLKIAVLYIMEIMIGLLVRFIVHKVKSNKSNE